MEDDIGQMFLEELGREAAKIEESRLRALRERRAPFPTRDHPLSYSDFIDYVVSTIRRGQGKYEINAFVVNGGGGWGAHLSYKHHANLCHNGTSLSGRYEDRDTTFYDPRTERFRSHEEEEDFAESLRESLAKRGLQARRVGARLVVEKNR